MRAFLPGLSFMLWGLLALSGPHGPFSGAEQELYYLWLPVCIAIVALALILLRNAKDAVVAVAVQCAALLTLMGLLPYLLFAGGGV
ncbi:MAG TPA: hypothetical protein VFW19_16110 [Allosphingosinicella sp.]|nr:hypothetical protein [Allosphingosinicella sp.]